MAAACSGCGGPLPDSGTYSVSVSLPATAVKRWRTCNLTCSPRCLAAVTAEMHANAGRRAEALMTERPRAR